RHKLALLDCPFDKDVVALIEGQRDFREVAIEGQAVPVRALVPLLAVVLEPIGLTKPRIGDGHTRWKISKFRLPDEISCDLDAIHLHVVLLTLLSSCDTPR